MDLSKYTFRVVECAPLLDEIEPRLGVKFDRKELFDHEQSLVDQSRSGPRIMGVCWTFKFSKTGSHVHFFTSKEAKDGEIKECGCRNHVQITSRRLGYGTNALECALDDLRGGISKIQALRQPQQGKQMTTQDKETHMHETIARASLVAFAEFIGQPISDLCATLRQARGLYGREGKKLAVVVKIPIDKTKPITANAVDSLGVHDGVKSDSDAVTLSYWPVSDSSGAKSLRITVGGMLQFAKDANERLATERAKLTPPPPKPEPIPFEAECRAHVKTLNAQLGINLNEDVVLAAGEAVRSITPSLSGDETSANYCLSIRKGDRAASFSVTLADPDRGKPRHSGIATFTSNYCAVENGLRCALADIVRNIPRIFSQLTPPPPAKPALTADGMRPGSVAIDRALETTRPPIYVFGGKESDRQSTDNAGFFGALTGGATRLYLTFQRKTDRAKLSINPRVHVHTEPMFFPSEFNTTISAPIDPTNPAATLTALADRIRNENL